MVVQNLSYCSAYNDDDDFGFGSIENNSRIYSPDDHHRNREVHSKIINRQRHSSISEQPKEILNKKK